MAILDDLLGWVIVLGALVLVYEKMEVKMKPIIEKWKPKVEKLKERLKLARGKYNKWFGGKKDGAGTDRGKDVPEDGKGMGPNKDNPPGISFVSWK